MDFDLELEDILYTVKENKTGEKPDAPKEEILEKAETEVPAVSETEAENSVPDEQQQAEPENLVWSEPKQEKKKKRKKDQTKNGEKEKRSLSATFKSFCSRLFSKRFAVTVGVAVLCVALGFGGVKLYQYSKIAYLKPFEEKYHIEYPVGIGKEFCDAYGKNPSLAGEIVISDTDTKEYVYSEPSQGEALFEKGSSVYEDQHCRAIALSKEQADLEKVYATSEAFLASTQTVTFKTLFNESNYRVVAAFYTNTKPEDDNGYVFPYNCYGNMTSDSFYQYQDRINTRRLYNPGYDIAETDDLLTVSVDSDIMENFRFVIVCVKVKGSVTKVSSTQPNEKIHYPQVWCDAHNMHNSYFLAGKWYPEIYTNEEQTETQKLTLADFQ